MSPCQPGNKHCVSCFCFFARYFWSFYFFLGSWALRNPKFPAEKNTHTLREQVDRDSQNTSAKNQDLPLKNVHEYLCFCAENMCTGNLRNCLVISYFRYGSTFDVEYGLILVLRSQIFECLGETFYRHALGYLEPACSEINDENICSYGNT